MTCLTVVRHKSVNVVYASMGSHEFAAIGVKLHRFEVDNVPHFEFHSSCKQCEFLYVTDPLDWEVIPFVAMRLPRHGIVLQKCANAVPLMQHALRQELHELTEDDIANCIKLLELDAVPPNIEDKFLSLAKHFCGSADGDSDAVKAEVALYHEAYTSVDNTDEQLLSDPLLEAVYDDMDDEDKGEFREIGDAKRQKRYRARVGNWQRSCDEEVKRKRFGRLQPKARGKAKSKAVAKAPAKAPAPAPPDLVPGPAAAPAAPQALVPVPQPPPAKAPAPGPAPAARALNAHNYKSHFRMGGHLVRPLSSAGRPEEIFCNARPS